VKRHLRKALELALERWIMAMVALAMYIFIVNTSFFFQALAGINN
jgi:hypothetical protein